MPCSRRPFSGYGGYLRHALLGWGCSFGFAAVLLAGFPFVSPWGCPSHSGSLYLWILPVGHFSPTGFFPESGVVGSAFGPFLFGQYLPCSRRSTVRGFPSRLLPYGLCRRSASLGPLLFLACLRVRVPDWKILGNSVDCVSLSLVSPFYTLSSLFPPTSG